MKVKSFTHVSLLVTVMFSVGQLASCGQLCSYYHHSVQLGTLPNTRCEYFVLEFVIQAERII